MPGWATGRHLDHGIGTKKTGNVEDFALAPSMHLPLPVRPLRPLGIFLSCALGALTVLHCGGEAKSGPGGSGAGGACGVAAAGSMGASGARSGAASGSSSSYFGNALLPEHRPASVTCPSSSFPGSTTVACTTPADCTDAGLPGANCLDQQCQGDQCLTDGDCPAGSACGCASQFGGNAMHTNECVASTCRVDADCASGLCSPAYGQACGGLAGYFCHSAADTCCTDADCASQKSESGSVGSERCNYEPTVGHWQCAPASVCTG